MKDDSFAMHANHEAPEMPAARRSVTMDSACGPGEPGEPGDSGDLGASATNGTVSGATPDAASGAMAAPRTGDVPGERDAHASLTEHGPYVAHLEAVNVWFGSRQVLQDVHLAIPSRGVTVLVGRSGSGKSTLLRVLQRLNECLPDSRTTGTVRLWLDGREIDAYHPSVGEPAWLRARMGMVFQAPDVLPLSIRRNLEVPLRHALGLPGGEVPRRIEEALREAALWDEVADRLDQPASSLSGGQQQRLCLARALALRPALLLLDEPTASLDSVSARAVEARIAALREKYGVVMVSHGLRQALRLADRLVLVAEGAVCRVWDRGARGAEGLPAVDELENLLEEGTCS